MLHKPVLLKEVLKELNIKPDGVYVDCTYGSGSHSYEIGKKLTTGKIIAIDYDKNNIARSKKSKNITLIHDNFINIYNILKMKNIDFVDGILIDLGYSTDQLENNDYGLKFKKKQRLNMKISSFISEGAFEIINKSSYLKLKNIFKKYGEEKYASKIASSIIHYRKIKNIEYTDELSDIIKGALPYFIKRKKHPSKKVFQSLRIYINNEIENLKILLQELTKVMKKNTIVIFITFNSLEDRLVKKWINNLTKECKENDKIPILIDNKFIYKNMTKKPIIPTEKEIIYNPASRSAKMRVIKKIYD